MERSSSDVCDIVAGHGASHLVVDSMIDFRDKQSWTLLKCTSGAVTLEKYEYAYMAMLQRFIYIYVNEFDLNMMHRHSPVTSDCNSPESY